MQNDSLDLATLLVSLASLAVACVALWVARAALHRSDLNSSAAMIVAMNEGFANGWRRFLDANMDRKAHEFAEMLNGFEVAAAVYQEGSVRGVARELLEDYLCRNLTLFNEDDGAKDMIAALRETPNTFKYLRRFLTAMKRSGRADGIETLINMECH